MTPVEERIDHDLARKVAERIIDKGLIWTHESQGNVLARAYLALLTEHSAPEETFREACP